MIKRFSHFMFAASCLFSLGGVCLSPPDASPEQEKDENWNLHYQTTVIVQGYPEYHSPYSGLNSLNPNGEIRETVTNTLFLGRKLWRGGEFYFDPEISQGKAVGNALGIAGFPNTEATRAGKMASSLAERHFIWNNVARLFLRQTFGLSDAYESIDSDQNQLKGNQAVSRVVVTIGKMGATDIFDINLYSHDGRTQFMNWGLVCNGVWDFPADTKGYTNGLTIEYIQPSYSVRLGEFMVPKAANGPNLDKHWGQALGQVLEVEKPYRLFDHVGKVRILGYANHAHMGKYKDAVNSPPADITQSREYRFKYGAGINIEQEITKNLGSFVRLGWNDGKTETWAYTEIDRTASFGFSLKGVSWSRPDDAVGLAELINGLSRDHRGYLRAGGMGFIIGDGKLNYTEEKITELYYSLQVMKRFSLTLDYQFIADPAYNADRGPVSVVSGRVHYQF